ncbi:zinc finger protein 318 isoform X2 [Anolis carolinensis]|uniref:zinc finger protein 318 isoform X2 n=1 Tax=Anolis carolinensis TaxID=28377 RepID=UPI002F2B84A9
MRVESGLWEGERPVGRRDGGVREACLLPRRTVCLAMFRAGSSGLPSMSSSLSSSRAKESGSSSSSGSRSSRSGPSRGRSPPRRSPSPRSRTSRRRHRSRSRSPSGSRASRRSPSPRRSSRRYSPGRRSHSPGRRSRSAGRRSRSPGRRSRSPGRRSRSPGRRSRSPGRRSRSPGRRSCSPRRCSHSPRRRSRSPGQRTRSPGQRSLSRHSESSVEQNLQITVGNDRYGIDTPERKRLCDRLGSPVDSLSDVDRDDLADGPIFSRSLSRSQSLERYPSREENLSSPFHMRHDEDYHSRDVFVHQLGYGINYEHLQDKHRETDRDGEMLRKPLYSSGDRGRETKHPRYDRDDNLLDASVKTQGFLPGMRNYRKRSFSRSPSPSYVDKYFHELESVRRRKEKEELSRNLIREVPGNGYTMPSSSNPVQSSEPRYLYRPDDAPTMPKKSILKKRVEEPSVQPEVFPSSSVKEPPFLSNPSLPQHSSIPAFALEVENFLKRFNKNAVAESATNKTSQGSLHDWQPLSEQQQNASPFEQNSGSFLSQKDHHESVLEPADPQSDFLLPHEKASQDGSGFSRILSMMADSTSTQEKRRRSFPDDIENEEKFLYGNDDDDEDSNITSASTQKLTPIDVKEPVQPKVSFPPPAVKPDTSEESRPEYEKIHDLLKTIGLEIGVAEIGKLAARTQERLHGKKTSHSPDCYSVASHKPEFREIHRSRSNTHSPEPSQKCSLSPSSSFPPSTDLSSVSVSDHTKNKGQDNLAGTLDRSIPPIPVIPSAPPSLPNLSPSTSVSQYNVSRFPPFTPTQLSQNYPSPTMPPPGYDAYGHYMAYAASGWPMYPQQAQNEPAHSDVHGLVTLTAPPNPSRPNLRVIETISTTKGTPEMRRDESVLVQIPTATSYSKMQPQSSQPSFKTVKERLSDERNRASQKQKVIEEREKLKAEQDARQKKLHYLRTELNRLSKQQGEMLRKKRREKDGHKDPLLVEVNRLQENIMKEIDQLKMNADAAEKKQSELDKVAQILGINISEKSRKLSSENKDLSEKNKSENAKNQERTSGSIKESKTSHEKPQSKSPKPTDSSSQPSKQHLQATSIYDYYDTGNHWCKDCNTICGTMFDFFTHMHNKKHRQTLDPYNRPWASKIENETKQDITKRIDKIPVPAKGCEFLIPITGYYCQLCHEFFGDQISAEQHMKSHPHNEKYMKHIEENPLYEERRNLDRQAGLSVIQETERRLKRKQSEKQKDEKYEKTAKTPRKEELKSVNELGDGNKEYDANKKREVPSGQKSGIKLRLKKDDKEIVKKEGKKEDSPQESKVSSFGKFSWRKTEKEEKNQVKDVDLLKEESTEECKDKDSKSQSGKSNSKPIAIKLSGKTVIPHTSTWTPVVSTSSQAKIKPNLPVPTMVLRKSATTTVNKPAPLNTFLSIKSSGASNKPLPFVKEGNQEVVLAPDIISKAFGGEVVDLKGSQEDAKTAEQVEDKELESVKKAIAHAKGLEEAKMSAIRAQLEEAAALAQAKAKEFAIAKQRMIRMAKKNEQSLIFERSKQHRPFLSLPAGPLRPLSQQLQSPVLYLLPSFPPPKQAVILADDLAPGVSEDDKNILAMPMCPRPLPPPNIFRNHTQKLEKKNTSLAAGNAQDLYDVFYNSTVRSPADSKLVNSSNSDKGKFNSVEKERKNDMLASSKVGDSSSGQQSSHNVCSSSSDPKNPLDGEALEKEKPKTEEVLAVCEESSSIDRKSDNIPFSDTQSVFGNKKAPEYNVILASDPLSFQKDIVMGASTLTDSSKKSPHPEKAEFVAQVSENNTPVLASDSKKPPELAKTVSESSGGNTLTMQLEDTIGLLEGINMKPLKCETSEVAMETSESSVLPLKVDNKMSSELNIAECQYPDDNKLTIQLLENIAVPVENVNMKLLECETSEIVTPFSENKASVLEVNLSKPLDIEQPEFECNDSKFAIQLSENIAPVEDVSIRSLKCEASEIIKQFSESNAPLECDNKKPSELEIAEFKCPDDKELGMQLLENTVALAEDLSKKKTELETAELAVPLPDSDATTLEELPKNPLVPETVEFKSADNFAMPLSEDRLAPLEDAIMKTTEFEMEEFSSSNEKESAVQLPEKDSDFNKKPIMRYDNVTNCKDTDGKLQDQQNMGGCDKSKLENNDSDLEMKASVTSSGERDSEIRDPESAEHPFVPNRGDSPKLFELQIEANKEGSVRIEGKQNAGTSEVIASTSVSDVQNELVWNSCLKGNEEDLQIIVTDQTFSKEPLLNLKVDTVRFDKLELATASDEIPQTSEIENLDTEYNLLNKGDPDSFHSNREQELMVSSQTKDDKRFYVDGPELGKIPNECLTNVALISNILEKHEEINQQPVSGEGKCLQSEEVLRSISSTNDGVPSSSVEFICIKNDTYETLSSDTELNGNGENSVAETENVSSSNVHSETVQESLDALSTEINVGPLGDGTLTFTDINTGVLNTPAVGDFDLNSTCSAIGFHQSTTLTLNLNIENERDSPKSDEIKPSDTHRLKAGLDSINFRLGDIEMEHEPLGILPSEILNEDIVDSPKLEMVPPISLESSKTTELDIDRLVVESEMNDFVALTSGEEEGKFCPLLSGVTAPHVVFPSSANNVNAKPNTSLLEMQDKPPISEVLEENIGKYCTDDMLPLSCDEKDMQSQVSMYMDTLLPDLKKTPVEVGDLCDSELYNAENETQISEVELIKTEEENNDISCEVATKLTPEVTEGSTEHLLL